MRIEFVEVEMNEDKDIGTTVVDLETEQDFTPWEVKESKVPGYERNIDVVEGDLLICEVAGGGASNPKVLDSVRANARLLAAAPELYQAARFARSVLAANPVEMSERMAIEKLEAALALIDKPATESAKRPISDETQRRAGV